MSLVSSGPRACGGPLGRARASKQLRHQRASHAGAGGLGRTRGTLNSGCGSTATSVGGYHDNPEGFICPSPDDAFLEPSSSAQANMRLWFWGQQDAQGDALATSPFVDEDNIYPPLSLTSELSYGWTRKGMNCNVRSTAIVGADRAVRVPGEPPRDDALIGNHEDGWNVLRADCTVEWMSLQQDLDGNGKLPAPWLVGTNQGDGFLSIRDQSNLGR